jgi:glycosyltransferase involved in cell wall biosynthesis
MTHPMRVCFVCPYAYPLFAPQARGRFGGSEVRAWLFSRGLVRQHGHEVAVAVIDQGQPPRQLIDGVEVVAMPAEADFSEQLFSNLRRCVKRRPGPPWITVDHWTPALAWQLPLSAILKLSAGLRREIYLRRFHARQRSRVLDSIAADVYCSFGVHHITAETVAFCRRRRRKSVLMLESDSNLSNDYRPGSRVKNLDGELAHVCHYGLAHADCVIAQTAHQQQLLRTRFGRESFLISDPIDLDCRADVECESSAAADGAPFALWIGKSEPYKRPDLCVELARRCPEVPFLMVLNHAKPDLHERVVADAPANLRIVEQVAFERIESYFARARVLINTSDYEGFPVTFLQAGKYGVPVVSLRSNPEEILTRHGCGVAAEGSLDAMADGVRAMYSGDAKAAECAMRIKAYVAEHHELNARLRELAAVSEKVAHA